MYLIFLTTINIISINHSKWKQVTLREPASAQKKEKQIMQTKDYIWSQSQLLKRYKDRLGRLSNMQCQISINLYNIKLRLTQ